VTVHELTVHDVRPTEGHLDVDISVRCSSGTYIRAIARDVGAALGVGGHLTALRRTAVGPYGLDVARTLEQLEDDFAVLPIGRAARAAFPSVELSPEQEQDVRYGRRLALDLDAVTAVFAPDGTFLALYEGAGAGVARPSAVFVG
jgi:tRNA pseudouridine55 synthase